MVPLLIPSSCSSVWYLGFGSDLSPSKVGHIFEMNYCFNCYGRMKRHCTIILYHSFIQGSTLYKKNYGIVLLFLSAVRGWPLFLGHSVSFEVKTIMKHFEEGI